MRVAIVFCAILALGLGASISKTKQEPERNRPIKPVILKTRYFKTQIDHFRPQDSRTVEFEYQINDEYYHENGPIFIYVSESDQFTTQWIEKGLMVDIAKSLNGTLVSAEHRYFGKNIPTPTASYDDMTYATVSQTLADIANLIQDVKNVLNTTNSRVILWGSRYGATLATYARLRYPHLVDAAWSSSGGFQPEPTSQGYYNLLSDNIQLYGDGDCHTLVREAFARMQYLIQRGQLEYLPEDFNFCSPINHTQSKEVSMFFEFQMQFISDFVDKNHIHGLKSFCRDMRAVPDDPMAAFARWVKYNYGSSKCLDFSYHNYIEDLKPESWDRPGTESGRRQLHYWRCTEIGYMKTTSGYGVFPNEVSSDYQYGKCLDVFGENYKVSRLVEATNALIVQFGSKNQRTSRVLYTNGMLDGWVDHAITEYHHEGSEVINLFYTAKSADLESVNGWESVELDAAKREVRKLIEEWSKPIPK